MERRTFTINTNDPAVKFAVVQTVVLSTSTSCVARSEPLCLFPIYRAWAVYEHWIFFPAHTQNRQLAGCEEIFCEFD